MRCDVEGNYVDEVLDERSSDTEDDQTHFGMAKGESSKRCDGRDTGTNERYRCAREVEGLWEIVGRH